MTVKAGQKCTAVRRILVPARHEPAATSAIKDRLAGTKVGDPSIEGVRMGPLVNRDALASARANITTLCTEAEIVCGDPQRSQFEGASAERGAFLEPVLLRCADPDRARFVHEVEAFGPVATIMPYRDAGHALELARRGGGSLVTSVYTEDDAFARTMAFGLAPWHGRIMIMNEKAVAESTGHGSAMPQLVHGGPGRAGGGEELGGLRGVFRYMQRVALQGAPDRLQSLCEPASTPATRS
jgi:oxepin-CoA hydrolase/3-oxo-5,6-dehydrosuberyl-CoA semialdehyde dehydrogenase